MDEEYYNMTHSQNRINAGVSRQKRTMEVVN